MDRNEELGNLAADVSGPKWPLCCTSTQLSSIRRASLLHQQILTSLCSVHIVFVPTITLLPGPVILGYMFVFMLHASRPKMEETTKRILFNYLEENSDL